MNKKTVSQKVKKFCTPFAMIYGLGIWFVAVTEILKKLAFDFGVNEWFIDLINEIIFDSYYPLIISMVFLREIVFLLPVAVVLALIIFGVVYARREGNIRNIFNVYIWGTSALVIISATARYLILYEFF